jgi:hypothetical protein
MLPWACRRPRAGSYSQVAIVAASVQPHVAYGSGAESLTRSKSGLHYPMADIDFSREDFSVGPAADVSVLGVEPSQKGWRAKPPQTAMAKLAEMV